MALMIDVLNFRDNTETPVNLELAITAFRATAGFYYDKANEHLRKAQRKNARPSVVRGETESANYWFEQARRFSGLAHMYCAYAKFEADRIETVKLGLVDWVPTEDYK